MGTASYVAVGLGHPESFESCQHGAGRAMSRGAARRTMTSVALFDEMRRLGVLLYSGDPKTAAEEAPAAYKDIERVMALSADLVRPVKRLSPIGVVKG
jgi:tRNA-splicing ligase RtcB